MSNEIEFLKTKELVSVSAPVHITDDSIFKCNFSDGFSAEFTGQKISTAMQSNNISADNEIILFAP